MQPASEKWSYSEELSCKEDSLKDYWFCFSQNQDTESLQQHGKTLLGKNDGTISKWESRQKVENRTVNFVSGGRDFYLYLTKRESRTVMGLCGKILVVEGLYGWLLCEASPLSDKASASQL